MDGRVRLHDRRERGHLLPVDARPGRRRPRLLRAAARARRGGDAGERPGSGRRGLLPLGAGAHARGVPRGGAPARGGAGGAMMDDPRIATIDSAWDGERPLKHADVIAAVDGVMAELDAGRLRVATKVGPEWVTHEWVKKAILLYFRMRGVETEQIGPFEYHDK